MKPVLLLLPAALFCSSAHSQALKKLADKAKAKVEQRANNKVDAAMEKGLDEAEGKGKAGESEKAAGKEEGSTQGGAKPETMQAYSKYDFVQGEKVIAFEDFSATSVGDFPTRWNTNGSAEIVTLSNREGKWMKINKQVVLHPEFIQSLPENFTLEFDAGVSTNWKGSTPLVFNIANLQKPDEYTDYYHYVNWRGSHAVHLQFQPAVLHGDESGGSAWARIQAGTNGNHTVNNEVEYKNWNNRQSNFAHVSLWRQGQRLRIYVNGQKVFDVPRAFDATARYNAVTFASQQFSDDETYYLLGNVRLAVGAPDTRNKLITEGKFVTTGITFDSGSDKLKPTSHGVLKEVAAALTENGGVKIRIVGHTDADGEEGKNLDLSKRRAAAVREALVKEFGIAADRIQTDGRGEGIPVGDNKTVEGKAQNRRVEFINTSKGQ